MVKSTPLLSFLTASSVLLGGVSAALNPIVIKGSKFFYSNNGTQFFIKGIAYQSGIGSGGSGTTSNNTAYVDPLADTASCTRDIPYLQAAGANTIRTYAIDPTLDHSTCMGLLDAAGIYVISDLGQPDLSINREDPAWTTDLYDRYTAVVDALAPYNNVIGFFAGNEVPNNLSYTESAAFVKAAVRDTKAYIKSKNYHSMGVGYAADDDATVRAQVAAYMNCGDSADSIDFWGYNIYEWCGNSNYELSGYSARVAEFEGYSVPAFFAEYGCNTPNGAAGRKFTEIESLYSSNMTGVFSGGIVYEYFEETNDYGLVTVEGTSVSTLADYNAWSTQIHSASPTAINSASYTPSNTASSCPATGSTWMAAATPLPPPPSDAACSCMMNSLSCVATSDVLSNGTALGSLFGEVCGLSASACNGVARNASTGTYGAWSMCNSTAQLNYVLNAYYVGQQKASTACSFGGLAQIVKPAAAASTCSSVVAAASSAASNTASGSGSTATGSGAASSTSKKGDASGMTFGPTFCGVYVMGAFTLLALFSGAGMILL